MNNYKYVCNICGSDEIYATWEVQNLPVNDYEDLTLEDYLQGSFYMDYVECQNCETDVKWKEVKIDEN